MDRQATDFRDGENRREWSLRARNGKKKTLKVCRGEMTKIQGACDMVVCSAFKHDYRPTASSLIGALNRCGYDVRELAECAGEDLRFPDGWISGETGKAYRRIACVELLDREKDDPDSEQSVSIILKKSFSTLRYMIEQASFSGIPVRTIAMTVPGAGNQQIRPCYILAPLIAHFRYLLEEDITDEITIYERNGQTASEIIQAFDRAFGEKKENPEVLISYSSRQQELAHEICGCLRDNGIGCWIAPESIPVGSSYQEMIPDAISSVKIVLLILTPEAVSSRWVQKEIGSAIGANKVILPYQMTDFELGRQFMFLLDGEQIMYHRQAAEITGRTAYPDLIGRVRELVG